MLLRRALTAAALAVAVVAAGCSDPPQANGADAGPPPGGLSQEQAARVIAKVGDRTITLGDFAAAIDRMDQPDRLRYTSSDRRRELLKQMIDVQLLADEAKKRGIDQEPTTQEAIRGLLRDALLVEAHKALPTPAEIPADEVKAYYDAHIEDYREPEKRRVSAIVLADEKAANALLDEAKKATDAATWGKLVLTSSEAAPKQRLENVPIDMLGDLGMVGAPSDPKGANDLVPEAVRTAVFKIGKVGEVYDGVVSADGKFYIVRMTTLVATRDRTLSDSERSIRQLLLAQRQTALENDLEADLRKKFNVTIDDEALKKLDALGTAAPAPSP